MEVLLVIGVALAAGVAALALSGARAPVAPPSRLLGRSVRRALRLAVRLSRTPTVGRLLGHTSLRRLAEGLSVAPAARALGLDAGTCVVLLLWALALSSVAVAALMRSPGAGVVWALALAGACPAREAALRRRERREVLAEMPGIFRTLSVAMGSGQTLAQSVEYVGAHERGPAGAVFARMSLRLRCGIPTEEAVGLLSRELDVPGAALLATALVIAHRTGSPLRDLLTRSARLAERQGEFERMLSVKTAQVRLSVRIVCLLPAIMVGVLALISPDFQRGLATVSGAGCVLVAALLDGLALALIRRLMGGVA